MQGKFRLPLADVELIRADEEVTVSDPLYEAGDLKVNGRECSVRVPEVGNFYISDGRKVKYNVVPGADEEWVKLHLNGQVLVALLHQRKIINFHASSFIHDGRGVMVLGDTGAGKSSLTVSFVLSGAGFLSDDLTPVFFKEGVPYILPMERKVKIRQGTAVQLNIGQERLADAEAGTGKKYLSLGHARVEDHMLHTILRIETGDVREPQFHVPSATEKFSILRSEICLWEILAGMPETEEEYLRQLVRLVERVHLVRVVRPEKIEIADFHEPVCGYLEKISVL